MDDGPSTGERVLCMLNRGDVVGFPAVEVFLAEVAAGVIGGGNRRAVVEASFGELVFLRTS